MWSVIAIVAVAVVVAAIVTIGVRRNSQPPLPPERRDERRLATPTQPTGPLPPPDADRRPSAVLPVSAPRPDPAPMHDLDDALAAIVDRSGTTMAERLAAEDAAVDELRSADETRPLLEQALDRYASTSDDDRADAPSDDRAR